MYEYSLVTIFIKLKYLYSVLPLHQKVTIYKAFLEKVNPCVVPW